MKIQNLGHPAKPGTPAKPASSPVFFNQPDAAVKLPVTGGHDDGYAVTINDQNNVRRSITPVIQSPNGSGNLVARA